MHVGGDAQVRVLRQSLSVHADARCGERVRDGVDVCIVGQPDVGKSRSLQQADQIPFARLAFVSTLFLCLPSRTTDCFSLLNRICRRPAAIVAAGAGTTRDVLDVGLDLGGFPLRLRDTAGIRSGDLVGAVEAEV